jgi:hypothetical protein
MGAIGHSDGSRFFPSLGKDGPNPQIVALEQQVQELTSQLESKQMEIEGRIKIAQIGADSRLQTTQMTNEGRIQLAREVNASKEKLDLMRIELEKLDKQIRMEEGELKRGQLMLEREALSDSIKQAERTFSLESRRLNAEIAQMSQGEGDTTAGKPSPKPKGAADLRGNDKAGVITRDNYDMIPNSEA